MKACLVALLFVSAFADYGVDISGGVDSGSFGCMVSNGYTFTIVRGYCSYGDVDPNAVSNIQNAYAGGMSHVDAYLFPCFSCGNPAGQVDALVGAIAGTGYGMIWLDIEVYQWGDTSDNINFIQGLIYFAICLIDKNLPCNELSNSMYIKIMLNAIFEKMFYPLSGYFLSILLVIQRIPKGSQIKNKVFILLLFLVEALLFEFLFWKKIIEDFYSMHILFTLTGISYVYYICKNYRLPFNQIKSPFLICLSYLLMIFLNAYLIKYYIIYTLNENHFFENQHIFYKTLLFLRCIRITLSFSI